MADPKPRLKKSVEKLREELLADADTKRIASAVGMELKEYVELVLDYAQNPDKEPVLQVASDEELRASGYNPPSAQEVAQFFLDGASGKIQLDGGPDFNKSGFESAAGGAGKPSLQGDANQKPVARDQKSEDLSNQVNPKGNSGRA